MNQSASEPCDVSTNEALTGYLHAKYAESLAEFGTPRHLTASGGWILERQVPGSSHRDAMGCYPIFTCQNWSKLSNDLDGLSGSTIAFSAVTDPFGDYDLALLQECFPDRVKPFKQHFVIDLKRELESFVHPHHLRNARKAKRTLQVELLPEPLKYLLDWTSLYEELVRRHNITGIAAFSAESFASQLSVPGLVAFRAIQDETTEGMLLWYVQSNVAYYHLGAYSAHGYDLGASFALFSESIEYFADHGLTWLNLGGAPGAGEGGSSGLGRFKEGWSTGARTAYFCGRIVDPGKYEELVRTKGTGETEYFPAYRMGEFG